MTSAIQVLSLAAHSNVGSLTGALNHLGFEVHEIQDQDSILMDIPMFLPGVGQFSHASNFLSETGLAKQLRSLALRGTPLVGICLGMQVLFEDGTEGPHITPGLGLLKGNIRRNNETGSALNIGWQEVDLPAVGIGRGYFAHSYHAAGADSAVCTNAFKVTLFPSVVQKGNIVGFQFHPELSGDFGLQCLKYAANI